MKYHPSPTEISEIDAYTANQRLHYFLTRSIESEEVWGLSNASGWMMKEMDNQTVLPVWPYESFAENCITADWNDHAPGAVSVEHFVYNLLPVMIQHKINAEILPTKTQQGKVIDSRELASLFEGMLDAGEYYMEG
jgi:hypothetical protein